MSYLLPLDIRRLIESYIELTRSSGYRGLMVLHSRLLGDVLRELYSMLSSFYNSCLLVAPSSLRLDLGRCELRSPLELDKLLGREFEVVIIATDGLLRPNLVAGLAGTVMGGGVLVLATPPLDIWDPGPGGGGFYKAYLLSRLKEAPSILWVDVDNSNIMSYKAPEGRAPERGRVEVTGSKAPRRLLEVCATGDQAKAVSLIATFLRRRSRSLMVVGDRGRGKSFAIGLGLALAAHWHIIGRVVVTGPTPWSVESLMRGLIRGLEALGYKGGFKVVEANGAIIRISGPWFKVSYEPPDSTEPTALTVIDEAGAIGVARVRRLSWKSGKVIVSTTIHGYEGSGRVLAHLVEQILPKPLELIELEEPIRYPSGDPLELWTYETFVLRGELEDIQGDISDVEYEVIDKRELSSNHRLLHSIQNLLALAHYRSEPDDLLVVLESPNHYIHILRGNNRVIAVADVALEEPGVEEAARIASAKLELYTGSNPGLVARIARISVHPKLQRRGYGSKLLSYIEEWARSRGCNLVLTIFSRHDVIGFWVKNGYKPYYVSPRYNRVTGEKNVAFGKPLTELGGKLLTQASRALRLRLLLSSSSIYRDLAAEKLVLLIPSSEPLGVDVMMLTEDQLRRLEAFRENLLDYEQASDAVYAAIVNKLARITKPDIDMKEFTALIARVIQGKPLNEVAEIIGVSESEARIIVNNAIRRILWG